MRSAIVFSVISLASLATGCAARKPPPPVVPVTNVTPELKAALERASACKYEDGVFDRTCDGVKAWDADTELANAGLLEMLPSEDPKIRSLIVDKLRIQLTADNLEAPTLKVFLDAAEKEKVDAIAKNFARGAAQIDLGKFQMLERGIAIAKAHTVHDYQEVFATELRNQSEPEKVAQYADELATSDNKTFRAAALRMYVNLTKTKADQACAGLDALRSDKESTISESAMTELARSSKCVSAFDGVLTGLEGLKLSKTPDAATPYTGIAVEGICKNADKTQAQRDRSLVLAKQMTETSAIQAATRTSTLSAVLACDPKGGPAFVKKFTKDKDATVAEHAKKLLEAPAPAAAPAKGPAPAAAPAKGTAPAAAKK